MKWFMGKETRRGLSHSSLLVSASTIDFEFHNIPHIRKSFLSWFSLSVFRQRISNLLSQVPRTHWPSPVLPLMWRVLLLDSLSLCLEKLHCTSPLPCNHTPNLPFQNNVQLEEVGSHIALFFGKEKTGSFYLHRRDFAELPSGEKKTENVSETQRIWEPLVLPVCKSQFCSLPVSRARDAAAPQPRLLRDPNSSAALQGWCQALPELPRKNPKKKMLRPPAHQQELSWL